MKIILVDEDKAFCSDFNDYISRLFPASSLEIFTDGIAALSSLKRLNVDLMLLDVSGNGISVHELISKAIALQPQMDVIVHTHRNDRGTISTAIRAGAMGYVLKGIPCAELWQAITCVRKGGAALSPTVSRIVLRELQIDSLAASLDILTNREKQVFQCIEEGTSYKAISMKLNISRNTVHTHVKNIYSKLEAVNKHDAFSKARQIIAA